MPSQVFLHSHSSLNIIFLPKCNLTQKYAYQQKLLKISWSNQHNRLNPTSNIDILQKHSTNSICSGKMAGSNSSVKDPRVSSKTLLFIRYIKDLPWSEPAKFADDTCATTSSQHVYFNFNIVYAVHRMN